MFLYPHGWQTYNSLLLWCIVILLSELEKKTNRFAISFAVARFVGFQILNSELLFLKKKKVTLRASPVRVLLRKSGQGWAKLSRLQSDSFLYLEAYHVQRRKNKAVSSTVKTNLPGAPWFSHEGPLVTGMPSVGVGSTHVGCGEADSRLWGRWGAGNVHGRTAPQTL